jgi:sRNA-binding protein
LLHLELQGHRDREEEEAKKECKARRDQEDFKDRKDHKAQRVQKEKEARKARKVQRAIKVQRDHKAQKETNVPMVIEFTSISSMATTMKENEKSSASLFELFKQQEM